MFDLTKNSEDHLQQKIDYHGMRIRQHLEWRKEAKEALIKLRANKQSPEWRPKVHDKYKTIVMDALIKAKKPITLRQLFNSVFPDIESPAMNPEYHKINNALNRLTNAKLIERINERPYKYKVI